jgi:hypothetical protein
MTNSTANFQIKSYIEQTEQARLLPCSSMRMLTEEREDLVVAQIGVMAFAPVGTTIRPL